MDFRRKFEVGLAWRTLLLIATILLIAKAAATPGVRAGLIVAALVGVAALASLWNFIRRTNFLVSRGWIFQAREGSAATQAARYVLVSGASLLLNTAGQYVLHDQFSTSWRVLAMSCISSGASFL